jgi:anthranilate synthase component 2
MLLLIDNYDSFTYNLVQYFGDLGVNTTVQRNDQITVNNALALKPRGIVISPGPSDPDHAGICLELINAAANHNIPLLGVCLGHQAIGQAFGGRIVKNKPMHGKISAITHDGKSVFKNTPSPMMVTRYHSLVIEPGTAPKDLIVTAQTDEGVIMGVMHATKPIHGVQFHPESIATDHGHTLLKNFTDMLN